VHHTAGLIWRSSVSPELSSVVFKSFFDLLSENLSQKQGESYGNPPQPKKKKKKGM
jgi:hypothetical protein